jgi:hypothetical protein
VVVRFRQLVDAWTDQLSRGDPVQQLESVFEGGIGWNGGIGGWRPDNPTRILYLTPDEWIAKHPKVISSNAADSSDSE